jgi:hypothetical protein
MNPYYDPNFIKKISYGKWTRLFLWLFIHPLYVAFGIDLVIFYKIWRGKIWIIGSEEYAQSRIKQ